MLAKILLGAKSTYALPDPNFSNVSLLILGGSGSGNSFPDSSLNAFTVTTNGDTVSTTVRPFTGAGTSAYFDGTGDYLSVASATALQLGLGNYTIECWFRASAAGSGGGETAILSKRATTQSTGDWDLNLDSLNVRFRYRDSRGVTVVVSTTAISLNTWYHVAVVRINSDNSLRVFINGSQVANVQMSTSLNGNNNTFEVGRGSRSGTINLFNGYVSNVRITKGVARYTANFTPPTEPFPTF